MENVQSYLEKGRLREALARLCHLAMQPNKQGQPNLHTWERAGAPDNDALTGCQKCLDDESAPSEQELRNQSLLWLVALDDYLNSSTRSNRVTACPTVKDGDKEYWLVRRFAPDEPRGYEHKEYGCLHRWLQFHYCIPKLTERNISYQLKFLPAKLDELLAALSPQSVLRIGTVSFNDQVLEHLEPLENGIHKQLRMDVDDAKQRLRSARAALDWARTEKIDILLFPELTLPHQVREALMRQLFKEVRTASYPIALILLGSFHELNGQGECRNRAVLVGHDGEELLVTDKRMGVTFGKHKEDISWIEAPQTLLLTPMGSLTALICKDFFDGQMQPVLDALEPDWVLVPSMSDKLEPHIRRAGDLARRFGTISAIANQPMPKGDGHREKFPYQHLERRDTQTDPRPKTKLVPQIQGRPSATIHVLRSMEQDKQC